MDWTALGISLGAFLLSAGGIIVYVRVLQTGLNDLKDNILRVEKDLSHIERDHNQRLSNHDVIFESLSVNQGYILQGIDEIKLDLKTLKSEYFSA